jgi:soluble lytic murein transglycosylase-like protein
LALLSFLPLFAGEYAVLKNGARLHIDRHDTVDGSKLRLFNGEGYTELNAAAIAGFESDGQAPPAPPARAAVPAPAPVPAPTPVELADAAADKYGLPRALVRSVMAAESGFQKNALSPKGAIGLMQLMPGTAQTLQVDPFDPAQNADAGARYLRDLLEKYDGKLWHALAAYNAGPGAVDKYKGVPPYRETVNYVKRIDKQYTKSMASPSTEP